MRIVALVVAAGLVLAPAPTAAQIIHDQPAPAPSNSGGGGGGGGSGNSNSGNNSNNSSSRASLDGSWSYRASCETGTYSGQLNLSGGRGTFRLTSTGASGPIVSATLTGRSISMTGEYSFMGTVTEYWTAEMDASGTSFTGSTYDTFGDSCQISATKR